MWVTRKKREWNYLRHPILFYSSTVTEGGSYGYD
jgi:hypothetical protein